jgi:hypothetical protein
MYDSRKNGYYRQHTPQHVEHRPETDWIAVAFVAIVMIMVLMIVISVMSAGDHTQLTNDIGKVLHAVCNGPCQ